MTISLKCSKCGGENDRPTQRYCAACHAANMREWRKARREEFEALKRASISRETIDSNAA